MIENLDSYSESLEDNAVKSSEIINGDLTNTNSTESTIEDTTKTPIKVNANGVIVEVEFDDSTFFVNVNGVILEFMVNGTEIIQVNNQ
jgi:hypothetical protein